MMFSHNGKISPSKQNHFPITIYTDKLTQKQVLAVVQFRLLKKL